MNAFPVEMTWASMDVEPFRDVNNLKDHGYTALSGSWPREFSKDVEKPRPTNKDSQRRQSRRARARSSRKVAKPRGPRSRTPGPADAPPTPTDHRDVGAPSPTPSTDDSSIHTTSLRSFDLASIWSSESDSTLGAHEHDLEHEHLPYSPTSPLAASPISQNEADLDTAAHADGLVSLADILAAFALDEQLISSPRDAFNDMCWASAVHEDGEEDADQELLSAARRAKEIRARRRTMMYACRQWSEGVGGYDAIDEVDEDEPHSHYADDPSPNYEEHQRDQRAGAGAHAASGLLFDEDAQMHFALADPCFHTPALPPLAARSRPLPRPRPALRAPAPVSAPANTLTFLALASPTTSARPEDSVHFFPIPANRGASPDAPAGAGFGLGWKRIANRLVGGARSRSRRE